jgi:hypothetical protein
MVGNMKDTPLPLNIILDAQQDTIHKEIGKVKPAKVATVKYWYKFYISECVLCGSGYTEKERMYTPKPEDPRERYEYHQTACQSHFL